MADKLAGMCKTEREDYEKYWDDINPFIKFGCLKDDKFCEKMMDLAENLSKGVSRFLQFLLGDSLHKILRQICVNPLELHMLILHLQTSSARR